MRRLLVVAAVVFGAVSSAQAADMPDFLRGGFTDGLSRSSVNWNGFYAGGQAAYSSSSMDFSKSLGGLSTFMFRNSVLSDSLSNWSVLNSNATQTTGFGAFAGYNFQFQDIVLGVEANYKYLNNLASSSSNSLSRAIVNPAGENPPAGHTHTYNVTLTGSAAAQVKDVVTFRGRAGWAVDNFLPYAFGGLAVGRMDVARSVRSSGNLQDDYDTTTSAVVGGVTINTTTHHTDFSLLPTLTEGEEKTNAFVFGWTAGLGFDYMLYSNVFLRAEWEYISFVTVKDTAISMNSLQAGLGYKF